MSADGLRKLNIENAKPDFRKIIEQFICLLCTNVLEDFTSCASCEGLICRSCLNLWMARETSCPLCQEVFEEVKVGRQARNVLNMCEFICPYGCETPFIYENRKRHFNECSKCTEQLECPFCTMQISQMHSGLTRHVKNNCEGEELLCPDCNLNVYQMYHDIQLTPQDIGHDCASDI